ncbi:PPE family protein [Mycobacterium seoulense]|nr:PPE family protein [Mycobacterium seoulense]
MDFGATPPEYNSARMYTGPGPEALTAAASAWNGLAAELNSTALGYDKVITALSSEEWLGPASASMAQAVAPYVAWIRTTAAQAEQTAAQMLSAATAYETALAATVPPPLVAGNRAQTAQLLATNVLGLNTPAIAQLEAQYGEMWAQDASAMYGYAGQSAAATKVTPFTAAPQIANPTAQATQGAAVASATGGSTASSTQSVLSHAVSSTPNTLQALATPASTAATQGSTTSDPFSELWYLLTGQTTLPTSLGAFVNGYNPFSALWYNTEGLPYFSVGMGNFGVQIAKTTGMLNGAAPAVKALPGLGGLGGLLGGGATAAHPAAALGNAASVGGRLSVPVTWSAASTPPPVLGQAIPVSTVSAAPEASGGPGNLLGGMPLAGTAAGGHGGVGPKYGFRPTVMARPPFGG